MQLPEEISSCIRTLEEAGYPTYAVGGCVRDALLGIPPHDYDLCTAALPQQICDAFPNRKKVLAGMKHGTIGIVSDFGTVEITTFRREGNYSDNRHPEWVEFVPDIREDLARRDFTVNAMAYSPIRGYADPFGGQMDLEAGILRAVGDPEQRFREDALRILRGVRFAVRFDFAIEPDTFGAMYTQAGLMDSLARERVFEELCGILPRIDAAGLARFAPILGQVIPELDQTIGFRQYSPHHAYDVYTHIAHVTAALPEELTLRWAGLLHDIGKVPTFTRDETGRGHFYGHAKVGAQMADAVLRRLKAPTKLREDVVWLIERHMTRLTPDRKLLRRYTARFGRENLRRLVLLQEADMGSKGTGAHIGSTQYLLVWLTLAEIDAEDSCLSLKDLAVNGSDLIALGLQGKAIGQTLNRLLDAVIDETLPNEREALLEAAKREG